MRWLSLTSGWLIALGGCTFDGTGLPGVGGGVGPGDGGLEADAAGNEPDGGAPLPIDAAAPPDVSAPDGPELDEVGEDCDDDGPEYTVEAGTPLVLQGDTSDASADGTPVSGCANESEHPDEVVRVRADDEGQMTITLESTGWNSALEVRRASCDVSSDDAECTQNAVANSLGGPVEGDAVLYIWIDGGNAGSGVQSGPYVLTVTLESD